MNYIEILNNKVKLKDNIKNTLQKYKLSNYFVYPNSFHFDDNRLVFFLVKNSREKFLGVCGIKNNLSKAGFSGVVGEDIILENSDLLLRFYNKNRKNYIKLLSIIPALLPVTLNKNASFGFGDRLGLATPGHIRVINEYKNILPVFAQQSVRELNKTNRNFKNVIEDAAWNIFQEGYNGNWGADADHLKEKRYFKEAVDAGFTMFTLDTSDVLNEKALSMSSLDIDNCYDLDSGYIKDIRKRYAGKKHKIGDFSIIFNEDNITRIGLIYGKALDFTLEIFSFLKENVNFFDYEISFDETNSVTTPEAHFFISSELNRRNIKFNSLALKFPGKFEKGIDYLGDLEEFEKNIRIHSKIAKEFGNYKLSLHSGSDKFSIYSAFFKYTDGIFHIKTSGTSWLEALHVISICNPKLFREVYKIAVENFEENKKAYSMSLNYTDIPKSLDNLSDKELRDLVYNKTIRQSLHISYGQILEEKREEIYNLISENEELHNSFIESYLKKHFRAFNKKR